jgi:uncharacterized RDD family membrane protein YckC
MPEKTGQINQELYSTIDFKKEEEYVIAGFNERFLAYLIDTLPFVFLNYYTLTLAIRNGYVSYSSSIETKWKIIWATVFIIYETVFTSGGRRTLGKKIMGIRVISKDGKNLNVFRAFIRAIGYFLSSFIINIGYLIALTNNRRVSLHDFLASSFVVKTKQKSPFMEGLIVVLSWSLMAFLVGSWANRTILTPTPTEKKQIAQAQRTLSKLSKLQEIHYRKYGFYTNDIKRLAQLTGNVNAVRYELAKTLEEGSLEITSNGRSFIISARAKNWRKTKVQITSQDLNQ